MFSNNGSGLNAFGNNSLGISPQLLGGVSNPGMTFSTGSQPPLATSSSLATDPIMAFLADFPHAISDPARVAAWTELVQYRTKQLELQIAEARKKEREAEVDLAKLKALAASRPKPPPPASMPLASPSNSGMNTLLNPSFPGSAFPAPAATPSTQLYPYYHGAQPLPSPAAVSTALPSQPVFNGNQQMLNTLPQPMTISPFDLQAIAGDMDDMFNWLPDFDGPAEPTIHTGGGINPAALQLPGTSAQAANSAEVAGSLWSGNDVTNAIASSPIKRRSSSAGESVVSDQPVTKKTKRANEKKTATERMAACSTCGKSLAKVMIRAPKALMPSHIDVAFKCQACAPVRTPNSISEAGMQGSSIGTVETRKRMRMGMEADDEEGKVKQRRQFCDVCQRIIGSGWVRGGKDKESIAHMTEIICASCDGRYQRCTDCGGGGGVRIGIGKWRLRQVYQSGRKTCGLSHSRLGDRPKEIGVHVIPADFTPDQLNEVVSRCKALWQEKTLSRLAVPEMLEIDLPPNITNPLRSYADIENLIARNWPAREVMLRAEDADPNRFKRILGLIWAYTKPRRNVRTVDLEEQFQKTAQVDEDEDTSTVLDNVKRTNVVIPAGCELIGMWGGEWDMQQGSILVSTLIPFEGTDGEDSIALSVGEMITKAQTLQQSMNEEQIARASATGVKMESIPQVEHLWVVSGGHVPLVRERMADILIRKRSFVHVEEYLTRHPGFINALNARPYGMHPDIVMEESDEPRPKPLVLVRWLGKDFDAQKIREIKQMEFGGRAKPKKRTKSKA